MTLHLIKPNTGKFWCGMGIWDDWSENGQYTNDLREVNCEVCKKRFAQAEAGGE